MSVSDRPPLPNTHQYHQHQLRPATQTNVSSPAARTPPITTGIVFPDSQLTAFFSIPTSHKTTIVRSRDIRATHLCPLYYRLSNASLKRLIVDQAMFVSWIFYCGTSRRLLWYNRKNISPGLCARPSLALRGVSACEANCRGVDNGTLQAPKMKDPGLCTNACMSNYPSGAKNNAC